MSNRQVCFALIQSSNWEKLLDRVRTFHVRPDVAIWLSRKAVGIKEKPLIMIDYQRFSLFCHLFK